MSNIIGDFYYGNIEPQEVNSELTPKLKKKLSNLAEKEEQLTARLLSVRLLSVGLIIHGCCFRLSGKLCNHTFKAYYVSFFYFFSAFHTKSHNFSFVYVFLLLIILFFSRFINKNLTSGKKQYLPVPFITKKGGLYSPFEKEVCFL